MLGLWWCRCWEEGVPLVFDDCYEHEVRMDHVTYLLTGTAGAAGKVAVGSQR